MTTGTWMKPEIDQLPCELTQGVTATREGLVFNSVLQIAAEYFHYRGSPTLDGPIVIEWADAAERLKYKPAEPWCDVPPADMTDVDDVIQCDSPWNLPSDHGITLHRLAAILCDDADRFRVLHWCVHNLDTRRLDK